MELSVGDRLFFYTDGITEAANQNGEQYGVDNVISIIRQEGNILENIKTSLDSFCKDHKDDYAILMAEII
jgi:serine phosphatase RsbU (regulator of sigma subunit)